MTTKNQKLKMALTSTPMILIYVMVIFCVVAAIRQPSFLSPARSIWRVQVFSPCALPCVKWWLSSPAVLMYLSRRLDV